MRISPKKIAVMALAIAPVIYYFFFVRDEIQVSSSQLRNAEERAVDHVRSVASDEVRTEAFRFEKNATAKFNFNDKEIKHSFKGQIYLDWQDERVALTTMTIPGQKINFSVKAHFSDDYTLGCLEYPQDLKEEEKDFASLYHNILLDYAYKSNRDENGQYLSHYTQTTDQSGKDIILKIKDKYIQTSQKQGEFDIENSHHEILVSDRLTFTRGEESFKVNLPFKERSGGVTVDAHISYKLERIQAEHLPEAMTSRTFGECSTAFLKRKESIKKMGFTEFQEALFNLERMGRRERRKLARKLISALKSNPQLLSSFMDWANSVLGNPKLSAYALGILGSVGTPEAQQMLVDIYQEEAGHLKNQVLNTLTLMKSPLSSDTRDFLRDQADAENSEISKGALFALGSGIASDANSQASQEDLRYLENSLANTSSQQDKMKYLDALGNAGSESSLATLKKYTADSNSMIRAKAITSLRSIASEDVGSLYSKALYDSSARVRKAAWSNIKASSSQYATLMSDCSAISSDADIQKECAQLQ